MEYTDILISLRKILRSVNLESKRIEKAHGLSVPQYLCLVYLSKQNDYKSTLKDLKNHLALNASTITGIVSRLEKKGFAVKLSNGNDKRSVDIILTALGKETMESIPTLFHEKLSFKLKKLSDNELSNLRSSLDLIVELMEVENIDASPLLASNQIIEDKT